LQDLCFLNPPLELVCGGRGNVAVLAYKNYRGGGNQSAEGFNAIVLTVKRHLTIDLCP
jgi:hypothetical protein